jgi:hypothetical protein
MHHAAMANKKDMMFALARLGCDWRARADGIDGASATFVLCGQHGKTTRQQVGGCWCGWSRVNVMAAHFPEGPARHGMPWHAAAISASQ